MAEGYGIVSETGDSKFDFKPAESELDDFASAEGTLVN